MLINSSYFIGERNIPNTNYPDVSSLLNTLITVHEKEYLVSLLGYELYKLFIEGLADPSPDQRYLDILYGKVYTGFDGCTYRWDGLVSVTTPGAGIVVSLDSSPDLFFTVGAAGGPANNDDTYVNTSLAGLNYRVIQRGFGPLEPLKSDDSNASTADIVINPAGGFTWRNGIRFSQDDKYQIQFISNELSVEGVPVVPSPVSPIADYVYYWYLRNKHSQTADIGEVQTESVNSGLVTAAHKMRTAWNAMVEKHQFFYEFMMVNYATYPEFQKNVGSRKLRNLLTKINAWNL